MGGVPIRALARQADVHASTMLRQIRRIETRRDDPLIDAVLRDLGRRFDCEDAVMHKVKDQSRDQDALDDVQFAREARRVLSLLMETRAVLAVAADMDKAVVVRDGAAGGSQRTAVVDRALAEALALKEWIATDRPGRITRYTVTAAGRAALEDLAPAPSQDGFAEAPASFAGADMAPRRVRYGLAESPLTTLARRREKDGSPFLSPDLVGAGERLREDFELANMGPRVAQDWDRFADGGARGTGQSGSGPEGARARVAAALADLGPGLSDVVLRCCCYLEGLETAEKKLGWSARSGKIVLRIALMRLKRHYDEVCGPGGGLIG